MQGAQLWLEKGTFESGLTRESFKTRSFVEARAGEQVERAQAVS
jgi:hypothetical protein